VWVVTAVFSTLVTVFAAFVVVAASRRGIADPTSIWLTYPLAAAGVRLFGARLPDKMGPANVVAPALACFGASFLILASGPQESTYWLAGLLGGLGHGYGFPVLSAQVVTRIPEQVRGSGLAVYTAVWGACEIALAPLFGAFADSFGDAAMFSLAAVLAAVGIAAWAALEHRFGAAPAGSPKG
jgi:MFS family permease